MQSGRHVEHGRPLCCALPVGKPCVEKRAGIGNTVFFRAYGRWPAENSSAQNHAARPGTRLNKGGWESSQQAGRPSRRKGRGDFAGWSPLCPACPLPRSPASSVRNGWLLLLEHISTAAGKVVNQPAFDRKNLHFMAAVGADTLLQNGSFVFSSQPPRILMPSYLHYVSYESYPLTVPAWPRPHAEPCGQANPPGALP